MAKDGDVNKLKAQIRRLTKENSRLVSELKSLEKAFRDMERFLKDETRDVPLEVLIRGAAADHDLKEIVDNGVSCKKCNSTDVHVGDILVGKLLVCRSCKHTEKI